MSAAAGQPDAEGEVKGKPERRAGKKRGDKRAANADEVEAKPEDFVNLVPYRKPAKDRDGQWRPVSLSKTDKAPQLSLSDDRMSVTGAKGYRLARATHGAHVGTWYCEVTVTHLGATGHCRLGWATSKAELQAPVGVDGFGFGYRDLEGEKVHKALREPYGEPYAEGDVIGLLLHMPLGGRSMELRDSETVRYKGGTWLVKEDDQDAAPLAGSGVAFSKNGVLQGVAYADIPEGTYYPAASLYTRHCQAAEGATVAFNFGPEFRHAPPRVEGWPDARPVCELAGDPPPPAGGAAAGDAAAAGEAAAAAGEAAAAAGEAAAAAAAPEAAAAAAAAAGGG